MTRTSSWHLIRIHPSGRDELRQAIHYSHEPFRGMDLPVMHFAQHHQVVDFGWSAVLPFSNMVDVAPTRRATTPRASAVTGGDGTAHSVGNHPVCAADVEWLAVAVHDDRDDTGVAGEQPQILGGDSAAEVEDRGPDPGFQLFEWDVHVEVRAVATGMGYVAVVEHVAADVRESFDLAFLAAALVVGAGRLRLRIDQRGDGGEQDRVVEPSLDRPAGPVGMAGDGQLVDLGLRAVVGFGPVLSLSFFPCKPRVD